MYYHIEPEVAGGWGKSTIADTSCHPPKIEHLEYRFEEWLGDDILETFPCFIVTKALAKSLHDSKLTGFSCHTVRISKSNEFMERHPHLELPPFRWLAIEGSAEIDDFGISNDHRLVISDSALTVFRKFNLKHAYITAIP
ncbi:hypothetical protein [Pseudomonas viridiflava]|uniref:hypothetical protein n=1 Tax=Pseudomonas viridiflava TaxID=33069 RepID=UPI001F11B087|nr:hypothetical protein [Pseudomonas viridiflava]